MTSFTFFMYVDFQLARKQSRTVELRNVTDGTLFIHFKIVCNQCLFCTPFPQVYLWYTLINLLVSPARLLRLLFTSKNAVKPCSVIKITNAPLCTHVLTVCVIIAGQLNVNSWLSMSLRFIGIECDFMSKQWMDLIALNKGLIAQSKEVLTL